MKPLQFLRNTRGSRYASLLAAAASIALPTTAGEPSILVDLELSLVTDISGSVDLNEYNLQMDGYAQAFRNSVLHNAIGNGRNGQIAVNLVFFDDSASEGIGWTILTGAADANAFADLLDNLARPSSGGTNPASGINLATSLIFGNNITSTRQVIDVSGDGSGFGTSDAAARDAALAAGIDAINGLPIGDQSLADYYQQNIVGGRGAFLTPANSFEDFEASILEKLTREIQGDIGTTGPIVSSTLRLVSLTSARATTRDVGDRLFRLRAGRPQAGGQPVAMAPADSGAKGGMSSAKNPASPIVMAPEQRQWEVFGSVFAFTEDQDQLTTFTVPGAVPVLARPDTSVDIFGGSAGFEYRFNDRWSAGFAVGASSADVDMSLIGSADIDTLALVPYVSFYQADLIGQADFYADAMYAYGMTEYDVSRFTGGGIAAGSPDGDYNQIELTTGLNYNSGALVHGPYASLRWIDGTIDGYTERGPGAAAFPSVDYESLATNLGYQVSYPMPLGNNMLVPQARAAWEHEFEDDAGGAAFGLPSGTVDEDLAVLGTGLGYYMANGWNLVLDYEARLGSENESHYVGLKAGYEF
jgi:hypothetical protein